MSGGPVHPLTPFTFWGWNAPYDAVDSQFIFDASVFPVRRESAYSASSRSAGPVHIAEAFAGLESEAGTQYAVRWLCGSASRHVAFFDSPDAFGAPCAICADAQLGPGVYRCFDANGCLLYIGSARIVAARLSAHKSRTGWWPEVASVRVQRFASVGEARGAEWLAIIAENPRCNLIPRRRSGNAVPVIEEGAA
jgi:hypothetical protein